MLQSRVRRLYQSYFFNDITDTICLARPFFNIFVSFIRKIRDHHFTDTPIFLFNFSQNLDSLTCLCKCDAINTEMTCHFIFDNIACIKYERVTW